MPSSDLFNIWPAHISNLGLGQLTLQRPPLLAQLLCLAWQKTTVLCLSRSTLWAHMSNLRLSQLMLQRPALLTQLLCLAPHQTKLQHQVLVPSFKYIFVKIQADKVLWAELTNRIWIVLQDPNLGICKENCWQKVYKILKQNLTYRSGSKLFKVRSLQHSVYTKIKKIKIEFWFSLTRKRWPFFCLLIGWFFQFLHLIGQTYSHHMDLWGLIFLKHKNIRPCRIILH